jgi:WD40 repeat protein
MGYSMPVAIVVMLLFTSIPLLMIIPCASGTVEVRYADKNFATHQGIVQAIAWAPNSSDVVSGGNDGNAIIWNWETTVGRVVYDLHNGNVLSTAYSHDGTKVVSGDSEGRVKIWSAHSGNPVKGFSHGTGAVFIYDVAWCPNAERVITCGGDTIAKAWNAETGETIATFNDHSNKVNSGDYSPDGSKVVTGGDDNKIRIWNPDNGNEIRKIDGHPLSVKAVAWSPDGTKIVSGSEDKSAKIWNAATGEEILKFNGHNDTVLSVDWSPDSTKVVSGSADGTLKIWDASNGYEYVNFIGHNGAINSVAWSPDGEKIAAASDDTRATIWRLVAPPSTPKLTIPLKNGLRGETITIIGEAEAYFTPTEQLIPTFEYKFHSDSSWTTLLDPTFEDGKWQVEFSPDYSADLGYYHVRVRFQELNGLYSVWTQRDSGIQVQNNNPVAQITTATFIVYRAQQGFMGVAVDDLENEASEMSVAAQYSISTVNEWGTDIFSTPYYNVTRDMWICNFTFPGTMNTNFYYDLRVKCSDVDGGHSNWDKFDTSIRILNNPPKVSRLSFLPQSVFRGNSTTLWIDAVDPESGTDIELPEVEIKYWEKNSDWLPLQVTEHLKGSNFTAEYVTTKDNKLGHYDVRVKLVDEDKAETNWFYFNDSLTVLNNLPVASGDFLSLAMYNDRIELFDLSTYVTDFEDSSELLFWEIDGKPYEMEASDIPLFSASIIPPSTLSIEPPLNARTGEGRIKFKITDSDGDRTYKEIYIELWDIADCPLIGVSLISPANGLIVGETTVDLLWDINYTKGGPTYKIYLGESEDQLKLVYESKGGASYQVDGLFDQIEYFWKVTARLYEFPRTFESSVGSFTVNVGYEAKYDIELSFNQTDIDNMLPGDVVTLNLIVKNTGNVPGDIRLEVSGTLINYVEFEKIIIKGLDPGKEEEVKVTVTWPSLDSSTPVTLVILAKYGEYNKQVESGRVTFKGKVVPIEESSTGGWVWIVLLLVIIIGGAGAYVIFRIKKRDDGGRGAPEPTQFVMPPQDSGLMGAGDMGAPSSPPGAPSSPSIQPELTMEESSEPELSESVKVQEKIVEIIELLKVLEHHKEALEADMLCIEDPAEKQEITIKIEAIKTQQIELQQQAVIMGEKATSMVKEKEMDDIFGEKTESETKALLDKAPLVKCDAPSGVSLSAKTTSAPPQKTLPVKTMPVPSQKALPPKTVPVDAEGTKTGVEEKIEESIIEEEISPQEKEKMKVIDQLNELQEMLDKAKESGLDVGSIEVILLESRTRLEADKLEEAENKALEAKKALEEAMEGALPETLRCKIMELSTAIDKARDYQISVEDEADALIVIKNLKDAEKYREAISSIKGIQTSVEEKLLNYGRNVRTDKITEAKIEMGTFELEGRSNVDELRSYLDSAKESVEIDDFEGADKFLEQFDIEKQEEPEVVTSPVVTQGVPIAKTMPVPPSVTAGVIAASVTPPIKRVKRVRRTPRKIVKRKVRRAKTSPPPQFAAQATTTSPPGSIPSMAQIQAGPGPETPIQPTPSQLTQPEAVSTTAVPQATPSQVPQATPTQVAPAPVVPQVTQTEVAPSQAVPQSTPAQAVPAPVVPQVTPPQVTPLQANQSQVEEADNTQ